MVRTLLNLEDLPALSSHLSTNTISEFSSYSVGHTQWHSFILWPGFLQFVAVKQNPLLVKIQFKPTRAVLSLKSLERCHSKRLGRLTKQNHASKYNLQSKHFLQDFRQFSVIQIGFFLHSPFLTQSSHSWLLW